MKILLFEVGEKFREERQEGLHEGMWAFFGVVVFSKRIWSLSLVLMYDIYFTALSTYYITAKIDSVTLSPYNALLKLSIFFGSFILLANLSVSGLSSSFFDRFYRRKRTFP